MKRSDDAAGGGHRGGDGPDPRRPWRNGPGEAGTGGRAALDDDSLLDWLQHLPEGHGRDDELLEIVRSDRHFYVRQTAALRVREAERLKAFAGDRHVGQILVRHLSREEDVEYLEGLLRTSRHGDVRRAAEVQLVELKRRLAGRGSR